MSDSTAAHTALLQLLRRKSVRFGDFTLASGAKSDFYVDCRVTTMDAVGARLIGELGWALIRRAAGHASADIVCGPVRLDTKGSKATVNGEALKLTSHEYRLLSYMMLHQGRVVSRTELVEHLYDQDFDRDSNTIEVFVGRLRKKMGVDMIETVRGMGYRMREPEA